MHFDIPLRSPGYYVTVFLNYNVVATGGPPDPPCDVVLKGGSFLELWQVRGSAGCIEKRVILSAEDCKGSFDKFICNYIRRNRDELTTLCRQFELDNFPACGKIE